MTAFTYFVAILMVIVPFDLIGEVSSMRSITQDEGNNVNTDANDNVIILARQREQHQVRGHSHNVKQYMSANDDDDDEDDDDHDDFAWEKTKGIRRKKGIQKHKAIRRRHNKKRTKEGGKRRNWAKSWITQKKPVDVVLLVDASDTMTLWFMERIKRVQNITKGLAMEFIDSDRRNRIAIAQFDYSHAKILLQMGKWRKSSIKSAVNQLKSRGEYKEDESFGGPEQFTGYTVALITAKNIFKNSPRKDRENYDRIAILITDGMDDDRFNEDKIIRDELNVRIMAVFVVSDAKRAKKDFFNDPNGLAWAGVNKIVVDPENDIIFDDTGTCQTESDCADGSKCFFPNNSMYGRHRGYCGCLPPGTTFDVKKYSLNDCCLSVPLPYYATPEHYYDECF